MKLASLLFALLSAAIATSIAHAEVTAVPHALERTDGSQLIYHLANWPARGRRPVLLMLQGSGCDSVTTNARIPWLAARLAPDHVLLTIEKYGVAPGADGADCTAEHWRGNTLQQRVLDALQIVAALRREGRWNGEIVIFGGSEGGAVAAMLGPLVPEARAVIVWSSGIGLPLGEMIRQALPPPMQAEAERVFAEARSTPTADRQWGGASYRWWADSIDLVPARALVATPAPVLLIHGTLDQSAPIASARAARDLVAASGKADFLYREYDGYDHFMVDAAGVDHRAEVIDEAAAWLRGLARDRAGVVNTPTPHPGERPSLCFDTAFRQAQCLLSMSGSGFLLPAHPE